MGGVPGLTLLAVGNGDEEVIVHNQLSNIQSPLRVHLLFVLVCFRWHHVAV